MYPWLSCYEFSTTREGGDRKIIEVLSSAVSLWVLGSKASLLASTNNVDSIIIRWILIFVDFGGTCDPRN